MSDDIIENEVIAIFAHRGCKESTDDGQRQCANEHVGCEHIYVCGSRRNRVRAVNG
jgi:hypothetical protein